MKHDTEKAKRDRIILALLEQGSHEKAAASLGIAPSTIWRWLQKPSFQEEYNKAKREAYSRSMGRLQYAANAAVSTLVRVLVDKNAAARDRVKASDIVLHYSGETFMKEDLMYRVDKLERAKEQKND